MPILPLRSGALDKNTSTTELKKKSMEAARKQNNTASTSHITVGWRMSFATTNGTAPGISPGTKV